jgi:hypothetical protein
LKLGFSTILLQISVEVDITAEGNEALYDLYRFEIPVFFLETKYVCKNRIDVEKLSRALDDFEKK